MTQGLQLIRGLHNFKKLSGTVATIGNFDGIHLGHQHILELVLAEAKKKSLPSLLITFEPHPLEFFLQERAPARLTNFKEKFCFLKNTQLNYLLSVAFNKKFSQLSASDFIEQILIKKLQVKTLFVGEDFHFGKDRQGNVALLFTYQKYFTTHIIPQINFNQQRVSSSLVRTALQKNLFKNAQMLLGRPYQITGKVIAGYKRGRTLGFPTANITLNRKVSPLLGVFAVLINGVHNQLLPAMANIGFRPTINGTRLLLEVHIFDFCADIYGKYIEVIFIEKLRDEQKFANMDDLKKQLQVDEKQARKLLRKLT